MLLTIVGAISLAVALIGATLAIYKLMGRKPPKGLLPLVAGVSMIVFMAWHENSWYARTVEDLPATVEVIRTGEFSNFIQPWTLILPRINRFMAVDTNAVTANAGNPEIKLTQIIIAERYLPTKLRPQFIDCVNNRAADVPEDVTYDADGVPQNLNWFALEADDALKAAVCE